MVKDKIKDSINRLIAHSGFQLWLKNEKVGEDDLVQTQAEAIVRLPAPGSSADDGITDSILKVLKEQRSQYIISFHLEKHYEWSFRQMQ